MIIKFSLAFASACNGYGKCSDTCICVRPTSVCSVYSKWTNLTKQKYHEPSTGKRTHFHVLLTSQQHRYFGAQNTHTLTTNKWTCVSIEHPLSCFYEIHRATSKWQWNNYNGQLHISVCECEWMVLLCKDCGKRLHDECWMALSHTLENCLFDLIY